MHFGYSASILNGATSHRPPSRREFIESLAAVSASVLVGGASGPPAPVWALLADAHISSARDKAVRGANMAKNLARAVDGVRTVAIDAVVVNGDMAFEDGEPRDYAAFRELLRPVSEAGTPLHLTLGNHDHRAHAATAFGLDVSRPVAGRCVSRVLAHGRRFVFLDSLEPSMRVPGRLGSAQLAWLRAALDEKSAPPTVVFVHHNPDDGMLGLLDGAEFRRVLVERRCVKAVLFGHTHAYRTWVEEGLHFVNLPATGYRFKPDATLGWMLARWRDDGAELEFRAIDPTDPFHGQRVRLDWRADR